MAQLITTARLPGSGVSETAVDASLAFIESAKPPGEVQCALVMQMACTHTAAMSVLRTVAGPRAPDESPWVRRVTSPVIRCAVESNERACSFNAAVQLKSAVIEASRVMGVERLVVTHAQFEVVNMTFDEMKKAAG